MSNLFKKAAIFTDIHFGLKSNSTLHNEDCLAFVKWATAMSGPVTTTYEEWQLLDVK